MILNGAFGVFLIVAGVIAFALTAVIRAVKGVAGGAALMRGLEAALTTVAAATLARLCVGLVMLAGENSTGAVLLAGWAFGLWSGVIDTIAVIAGESPVLGAPGVLWFATSVGALSGLMDGLWAVQRWRGIGWLAFPLDVTWGLAGTTNGVLLHIVNFAWADHADEPRNGAHRYRKGFCIKSGFAFTQGAVMSSMDQHPPGSGLYSHEKLHVWQNRCFGPMFTLTYIGWMALMVIPGLIAGAARSGATALSGAEWWAYYNNPWEVWAYTRGGYRDANHVLAWSHRRTLAVSIPFFVVMLALAFFAASFVMAESA